MSNLESKGTIHIDAECVLYGEIASVLLEPSSVWNGWELGPPSALRMGVVPIFIILAIVAFFKELLVTSFDAGPSKSLGMKTGIWHYGLMRALAIGVVSAFKSVGAILAVAMLIVPPMFAGQLFDRLPVRLGLTVLHAALSVIISLHLSVWLNCSAAGAMMVAAALLFVAVWLISQVEKIMRSKLAMRTADEPETLDASRSALP